MDVEAVVGDVRLPADEPLGQRLVPLEHLLERLEPVQFIGHAAPKALQVFGRLAAEAFVLRHGADSGLGRKIALAAGTAALLSSRCRSGRICDDMDNPSEGHGKNPQWKLSINLAAIVIQHGQAVNVWQRVQIFTIER